MQRKVSKNQKWESPENEKTENDNVYNRLYPFKANKKNIQSILSNNFIDEAYLEDVINRSRQTLATHYDERDDFIPGNRTKGHTRITEAPNPMAINENEAIKLLEEAKPSPMQAANEKMRPMSARAGLANWMMSDEKSEQDSVAALAVDQQTRSESARKHSEKVLQFLQIEEENAQRDRDKTAKINKSKAETNRLPQKNMSAKREEPFDQKWMIEGLLKLMLSWMHESVDDEFEESDMERETTKKQVDLFLADKRTNDEIRQLVQKIDLKIEEKRKKKLKKAEMEKSNTANMRELIDAMTLELISATDKWKELEIRFSEQIRYLERQITDMKYSVQGVLMKSTFTSNPIMNMPSNTTAQMLHPITNASPTNPSFFQKDKPLAHQTKDSTHLKTSNHLANITSGKIEEKSNDLAAASSDPSSDNSIDLLQQEINRLQYQRNQAEQQLKQFMCSPNL